VGREVEGDVMVEELAQVGVGGRYFRILLRIAVHLRGRPPLLLRGHLPGQPPEISLVEVSGVQVKQPGKPAVNHLVRRLVLMQVPPCAVK